MIDFTRSPSNEPRSLLGVGVYDGLSAYLAAEAGYDLLWLSSFSVSATLGLPDINLITLDEMATRCASIVSVAQVPIIVDIDNGYGATPNAVRAARRLQSVGAAAICIEDAEFPKRCSFYGGLANQVVPQQAFARRIETLKSQAPGLSVIARTEALVAGLGVEEAICRARAYADAGADAIMVQFPAGTRDALEEFVRRIDTASVPIVVTPTGLRDMSPLDLSRLGVRVVIHANAAIRASLQAVASVMTRLRDPDCDLSQVDSKISSMKDFQVLTRADAWMSLGNADRR